MYLHVNHSLRTLSFFHLVNFTFKQKHLGFKSSFALSTPLYANNNMNIYNTLDWRKFMPDEYVQAIRKHKIGMAVITIVFNFSECVFALPTNALKQV